MRACHSEHPTNKEKHGNLKWRELSDKSIFDDDPILLKSYMESMNKTTWRKGRTGKPFRPCFRNKHCMICLRYKLNTRQLANKLGITRKAAWQRVNRTMKVWGINWEAAAMIVIKGFNNQTRARVKITPGMRFGRLVTKRILDYDERPQHVGAHYLKQHFWLCMCDCGNEKITTSEHLRSGHTQSCGCIRIEKFRNRNKTEKTNESSN